VIRFLKGFGRFWYDFIVGEDWKIAVGVVAALAVGAVLVAGDAISDTALAVIVSAAIVIVVIASVVGGALARR
jgi:hypothetical protein